MAFPVSGSCPAVYRPSQRPSFRLRRLPSPFARFLASVPHSFRNDRPYHTTARISRGNRKNYQFRHIFFQRFKRFLFVYTGAIRKPYVTVCFFVYSGAFFEVVARLPALSFSTQGSFFRNNIPYHYMEKISIADNQNYQKIRKIQESKHK